MVAVTLAACGSNDQPNFNPDVRGAVPAALSTAQVDVAKRVGLIPQGFLTPTFFGPAGDPPYDPSDPSAGTVALGINGAGRVVGFSHNQSVSTATGDMAQAFVADAAGTHPLPRPWPSGPMYATGINQQGYVVGYGGPATGSDPTAWNRPVLYLPDSTSLILPFSPITRLALSDGYGRDGMPAMAGLSSVYAGTMLVWHFDGSGADAVGGNSLPLPQLPQWSIRGSGSAIELDGNTCLSTAATAETAAYDWTASGLTLIAWVKPSASMCPGPERPIIARDGEYAMALACDPSGGGATLTGAINVGQGLGYAAGVGLLPFDEWTHVAISWDQHKLRRYVDGALILEEPLAGNIGGNPTWLAAGCSPGNPASNFRGAIDEVAAFRHPMGTDQIDLYGQDVTNYRQIPGPQQWVRYREGFFDVIGSPAGGAYAGSGQALATNSRGQIVGTQSLAGGQTTAMLYDPDRGWINLNEILDPTADWNLDTATAINNASQVVGRGTHAGRLAAYRLEVGTGEIVDLAPHVDSPWNNPSSFVVANAINEKGDVAGAIYDQWPYWAYRAFIYTDELGTTDLNVMIDPSSGWTLREATALNDQDEVVGWATQGSIWPAHTGMRAFKLRVPTSDYQAGTNVTMTPVVDCVLPVGEFSYLAVFGYVNDSGRNTQLPPGFANGLTVDGAATSAFPLPTSLGTTRHNAFTVPFSSSAVWTLGSASATAAPGSTCPNVRHTSDGVLVDLPGLPNQVVDYSTRQPVVATETFAPGLTVGRTDGDFAVTGDGAASYRVKLWTPPGRAGLQPELTLSYHSRTGPGPFGVGWTLEGLSQIARCERHRLQRTRKHNARCLGAERTQCAHHRRG
jgi:hypothetical protein